MADRDFYADCPHCDRCEFVDEDDWFEHVSMCEWEQEQDRLRDEEE
ncbi:hypothetical protein G7007_18725 [Pseudomonas entomophila]|nr:hypothetical protein [Pseudomonas entomophila]MBA1194863.1 hypothetical protein [Pseudomonas entomophila]